MAKKIEVHTLRRFFLIQHKILQRIGWLLDFLLLA